MPVNDNVLFAFSLLQGLIRKGVFTHEEAARVLTETANNLRSGTEDDPTAAEGERLARGYETIATWILDEANGARPGPRL